ncbi:tetratricopeptide repeat protein [Marichromatium purpuratum]|uniref:hypothetical protein n=1 Tax=Marichromatium purpuratum TaxID=37487 RepID=UPI0006845115|nr:hypothetical protein [Marichromatium purpuratum]
MTHSHRLSLLLLSLLSPALCVAGITLKGRVVLVGSQDELTPAEGVMVTLEETGDSERTKAGGLFNLPLPEAFRPGERITLQITKDDWRIQYPLDGELRVPNSRERQRIDVRLLPVGSKKWWSDDRIEKLIADMAAQAREQITPDAAQPKPDFGRYIQEWATQYGFSLEQAQAEIARWATEVEQHQDDLYKLGLAAFAEKHFGRAQQLFRDSAATNVERMRQSEERIAAEQEQREHFREMAIRDYRLEGDAAYNNYAFAPAFEAYENALALTNLDQRPQQWAEVIMDVAKAHYAIGIRTRGAEVQEHLSEAVAAYRAALEVYTRAQLPQQWATTQNNLGTALQEQGTRTGREAGQRLLAEAVGRLPRSPRGLHPRAAAAAVGDHPEQPRHRAPRARHAHRRGGRAATARRGRRRLPRSPRGLHPRAAAAGLGHDPEQPRQRAPRARHAHRRGGRAATARRGRRRLPRSPTTTAAYFFVL